MKTNKNENECPIRANSSIIPKRYQPTGEHRVRNWPQDAGFLGKIKGKLCGFGHYAIVAGRTLSEALQSAVYIEKGFLAPKNVELLQCYTNGSARVLSHYSWSE